MRHSIHKHHLLTSMPWQGPRIDSSLIEPFRALHAEERLKSPTLPTTITETPSLSVIIPAYNEATRLPSYLLQIIGYLNKRGDKYEIIVVDDGSSDDTGRIVKLFQKSVPQVRLEKVQTNTGKGNAVKVGIQSARGDLILFADADGATPITELSRLEKQREQDAAPIAIGSRRGSNATHVETTRWRHFVGRGFNTIVRAGLPGIEDTQCGFKLFTRDAAKFLSHHQTSTGFGFDVELLMLARRAGLPVIEVPVNWTDKKGSKVRVWRDSFTMLADVIRFGFMHRGVTPDSFERFKDRQ